MVLYFILTSFGIIIIIIITTNLVLNIKLKALYTQGKHSAIELHLHASIILTLKTSVMFELILWEFHTGI